MWQQAVTEPREWLYEEVDDLVWELVTRASSRKQRYFIVGTQKSGTTWLRNCFGCVVPTIMTEPYYLNLYETIAKHCQTYFSAMLGDGVEIVAQNTAVAAYKTLMQGYVCDKSAYPCSAAIGNLRPDLHPFAVKLLKQHFPEARVVVIVRDPRSVYVSLVHYLDHFRAGWSANIDPDEFSRTWAVQNQQWLLDKPHATVKYEDMKSDFSGTLRRTFHAIGLNVSSKKVGDIENRLYDISRSRASQPEIFRKGLVDEWRSSGTPAIEAITRGAQPLMQTLGYIR